ncbi:hypothetical protein [Streptomyces sp. NPDC090022]|uniref:hypothetical protein n=1 Tax=Streptomyces sp. NPDC090022 TaxID=3365920 RepID=UPI003816467E
MPHGPAGPGPRRRTVLAALAPLALAAGCAADEDGSRPAPGPRATAVKDALIMVIRHAEQPYAGDVGADEEGEDDPGSLALRGWRRAEALPRLFPPARGAALPRPATLFAAAGPARSRQTVAALAEVLRLPVRTDLAVGREKALARAALAAVAPVLICWEHAGIPRLVHALGADGVLGVPSGWPDRHDLVWTFTRSQGRWAFREHSQRLLPGDA